MRHTVGMLLTCAWTFSASTAFASTITTKSGMTVTGDIEGFVIQQGEAAKSGGRESVGYAVIKGSDIVAIRSSGVEVLEGTALQEFSCSDTAGMPQVTVLPAWVKRWQDSIARGEGPPFLLTTEGTTLKVYIRQVKVAGGLRTLQTHPILDKIYANEFAGSTPPSTTAQSVVVGSVVNGTFEPVIRIRTASGIRTIKANEL